MPFGSNQAARSLSAFIVTVVGMCSAPNVEAQISDAGAKVVGAVNIGINASGGTQRKNDVSGQFDLAIDGGTTESNIRRQIRFRADGLYGTSQSPGKDKTIGAEMYYLEVRGAGDLGEMLGSQRQANADSGIWVYGIGSVFHTIAFDLEAERAFGAGVSYDVGAVPGLSAAADFRHIYERFGTQPAFSSWGIGLHQSYARAWVVGTAPTTRTFVFSEAIDAIPAFESRDAFQLRAVVSLAIPIIDGWAMPITYGSDYMRNVPPAFKRHFWKTTFGLTYTFAN